MTDRFTYETTLYNRGIKYVVGVDEVGRGPLAGPVVAAAVSFEKPIQEKWWDEIKDSKKVSESKREELANFISLHSRSAVGLASVEEIANLNILQASLLAMKRSVLELGFDSQETYLAVDGKFLVPGLEINQTAFIKGDAVIHSIAAASILAKVTRDNLMKQYDREIPGYDFARHKGYGTSLHIEAIRRLGLSPIHRVSFCGNIL